ncbi:MAG: phosphatidate cytidylyltransferase [Pseudomonadota bacterium]|nr:phosphatidate cytidylyltransferase [Pseudomonadota bacterium]
MSVTGWLFLAAVLALLLASAAGAFLKWRVAEGRPNATIDGLNDRVHAWWLMLGVLGLAFAFGKGGVIALFFLISFHALREFYSLAYTRRGDHLALAAAFYLALPMQYYLIWIEWYGLYAIFIPVYAFLVLPILSSIGGDPTRFLERAAKVQWGLMVAVFCISHVPALLTLRIPGFEDRNLLLIAFLIIVVQGSDALQHVWGRFVGRHPLPARLAPSRTWEGVAGGIASASLLGGLLWWITPFSPWQAMAVAFAVCVMGVFGGLVMSAIKRDRGVREWGTLIEGHGGMLDRVDAVIFAAPIYFHLLRYGWSS